MLPALGRDSLKRLLQPFCIFVKCYCLSVRITKWFAGPEVTLVNTPVKLVVLVLLTSAATGSASGQAVYGAVFGTITDPSGASVSNVKIVVASLERGVRKETTSNENGNYEVYHLLPGQYTVKTEVSGFKASIVTDVPIHVDQATRLDLRLQIGRMTEKITVSASMVPLLRKDNVDVSVTFEQNILLDVPMPTAQGQCQAATGTAKGSFTGLELLAPGTSTLPWQHAAAENPQGGIQISVNGQNWSQTAYQLDGTDNRDPILGIIVISPNTEAVAEAEVTTQNFDPATGQAVAGVVSAHTKSGTNDFHGTVAPSRHTGGSPIPAFQQVPGIKIPGDDLWSVGASFGGPFVKDRLFFFGDYAGDRIRRAAAGRFNVPTMLVRQTCLDAASAGCDLSEYPRQIYDPVTNNTVPFAGNVIPTNRLSPQAIALLKMMPVPNVPDGGFSQNYLGSAFDIFNDDRFDVRIDHMVSPKQQYFGRYSFADFRRHGAPAFGTTLGGVGMLDSFSGTSLSRNQSVAVGVTSAWSARLLSDFHFGFFRYHVNVLNVGYGKPLAQEVGIPNVNFDNRLTSGMPTLQVDGQDGDDFALGSHCGCPLFETEQQFQWVSNWTEVHKNHQIRWGADFRHAQNLRLESDAPRTGTMIFRTARTEGPDGGGLGLASFLLGDVGIFFRNVGNLSDAGERQNRSYFYGQDTWRVTPKLSVMYGLRWEIYFPQSVTGKGRGGWLDVDTGEISVAGYNHINLQGNVATNLRNLAPRLGIAYSPNPKTVVRLGYGRNHDMGVFGSTFGHSVTENLPVLLQQRIDPGIPTASVFSLDSGPPIVTAVAIPASGRFQLPNQARSFVLPKKMRQPTVDAWNLTIQRSVTPTLAVQGAYVGNKGTHVFPGDGPFYDLNQASIAGFGTLSHFERQPFYSKFGWTQEIAYSGSNASNSYHSLQLQAEKRFTGSYEFLAHYTWSRALSYNNDYFAIDPKVNYGLADANRKHVFVLVNVIDFPIGRNRKYLSSIPRWQDWLVGGWTLAANTAVSSGLPFTPTYLSCGLDIDTGPCRPNQVGPVHVTGSRSRYFTTTAGVVLQPYGQPGNIVGPWQRPAMGTFGNIRRNSLYGPGFWESDIDVKKSFSFNERHTLEIHMWVANLFNKVNLNNPVTCVDCLDGGKILDASRPRSFGFDFRYQFGIPERSTHSREFQSHTKRRLQ